MEYLQNLGWAGFFFFLIKGCIWLVLFALIFFGVIDKNKAKKIQSKLKFWKKKNKSNSTQENS